MNDSPSPPPFDRILDARDGAGARALARAAETGRLERLRRGVYRAALPELRTLPWQERAGEARLRYLERLAAVALTHRGSYAFSHRSALAIWGLPLLSGWPRFAELTACDGATKRSHADVRVHRRDCDAAEVVPWGSFWVTSPVRTLADLARDTALLWSVPALDAALGARRAEFDITKAQLAHASAREISLKGSARAAAAIRFADGRSGSAGESGSRVLLDAFGAPAPQLQVRHPSPLRGVRYFDTDFEWPELHRIGEFDGRGKYLKPEWLGGRTPGDAVYNEKRREDALRAEGFSVSRWGWNELRRPALLRALLVTAGIPVTRAASFPATLW